MDQPQLSAINDEIFAQLDAYPWDEDKEFQAGLSAILGSATDPAQVEELTLRARCFYLSRKKSVPVDFDAYKEHLGASGASKSISTQEHSIEQSNPTSIPPSTNSVQFSSSEGTDVQENPKYPTTFAEIVKLITEGKHIPGVKEIPPTVLHDQATQATKNKRLKPWEKHASMENSTFGDQRDEFIQQEMPE